MDTKTHEFTLGEYKCFSIYENLVDDFEAWTGSPLIVGVEDKKELAQAAVDYNLDLQTTAVPNITLLIDTGDKKVLIDASSGKRPHLGSHEGELLQRLNSLGISAGDIDEIVITHSDHDHIGGILDEEGQLEFPNAHYFLSKVGWEYWSTIEGRAKIADLHKWPEERVEYVWETYSKIHDNLTIVDYGVEFLTGFYFYPAYGHRYDHDIVRIEASGQTLIHLVDTFVHPILLANPAWYYPFDYDVPLAIESQERMLNKCEAENALVFASHFPFPGMGRVERNESKWVWHPILID